MKSPCHAGNISWRTRRLSSRCRHLPPAPGPNHGLRDRHEHRPRLPRRRPRREGAAEAHRRDQEGRRRRARRALQR